ncbi:MAG: undecaprenyldiphospho-muramoylpentapeptide beta-N-acetylglucosaminyltransferase [Beijerinckiaceae bacterium]|nr:MAG: undecaprenyldiphospho-muramoylpentapeptide beta-N-acetylglucosaminyltransferase [Beijerinckiaceae bacterium]
MSSEPFVLLAAGGTGGHLFPAEALADALGRRGIAVELITDERAQRYGGSFPARAIHRISAATPSGVSPVARLRAVAALGLGTLQSLLLLMRKRPAAVVGFGGYPTVPPMVAAGLLRIPTILHEQNAVMGRANRFLAARVDAVARGLPGPHSAALDAKSTLTGNPVRPAVIDAATIPYAIDGAEPFRVLVTGGSQGARIMSDVVPAAIALLPEALRRRLSIVQQARGEDEERVRQAYAELVVTSEVTSFFKDLPARIAAAHLVIARAGASTVAELAVIGRPSILVPFPHAIDQDQAANAAHLAAAGAALIVAQTDFSPQWLAAALKAALDDPATLAQRAEAARASGIADAAKRLANLVLHVAKLENKNEAAA